MAKVVLREITQCNKEQQIAVRDISNQEDVLKSMYTNHKIKMSEHLAWLDRLASDKRQIVFIVIIDNTVRGLVSVNEIDRIHLKSDWAFCLDQTLYIPGLSVALEFNLINFVFKSLGIKKLNCEVLETNKNVVKLHKRFCFIEEGFKKENIIKNGQRIGVFLLGLTKSDWEKKEEDVLRKVEKIIKGFNIEIEYSQS